MPFLLSDIGSYKHDLSRFLVDDSDQWTVRMRINSVTTVKDTVTSHNEYLLHFIAKQCEGNEIKKFDMWTRFRDIWRLWCMLAQVHKKLGLSGKYPKLSNRLFFGKQNPTVIGERTAAIEAFFNFILSHPVLKTSIALQDYIGKASEIYGPPNTDEEEKGTEMLSNDQRRELANFAGPHRFESYAQQIIENETEGFVLPTVESVQQSAEAAALNTATMQQQYEAGACAAGQSLQPSASDDWSLQQSTPIPSETAFGNCNVPVFVWDSNSSDSVPRYFPPCYPQTVPQYYPEASPEYYPQPVPESYPQPVTESYPQTVPQHWFDPQTVSAQNQNARE